MSVRDGGFTLLEVLAALLVLALAAVVLADALGDRARLARRLQEDARLAAAAELLETARGLGGETVREARAVLRRSGLRFDERMLHGDGLPQRELVLAGPGRELRLRLPGSPEGRP